ncbi:MAG: metal ABC transporter solute-binding protein, Zn/Mn family [Cellvibrionaceae bacterium]
MLLYNTFVLPRMPRLMLRFVIHSLLLLWATAPVSAAPLKVVTSIYPLQLIAQAVLGPEAEVRTLLAAGQSPHNFALKVSDRRQLAGADLILWVGPKLEPYLVDITSTSSSLAMSDETMIDAHPNHRSHNHDSDSHLWLSSREVEGFVRRLAQLVVDRELLTSSNVTQNTEGFVAELTSLRSLYVQKRTPKPYAVAHRAYDHFLESIPFPEPITLSASPEMSPGARTLWRAGKSLAKGSCLIVDGGSSQRWLQAFAQRNQLTIKKVDLMGNRSDVSTYNELIRGLAEVFESCSGETGGEEKTPALVNK